MIELKSFDNFLNEAVSPDEAKELLRKGQTVTNIVSEIVTHQRKIAELYDKLKELVKGDEIMAPLAKSIEVAADKAKEDTKDAEQIEDKIEKAKKDYVPREGSAASAILKYLEDNGETTLPELVRKFGGGPWKNEDGNPAWNHATVSTSVEYMLNKGKIKKENKRNAKTNRMANFYSIA